MRTGVQTSAFVVFGHSDLIDVGGYVEETLRPQEIAGPGSFVERQAQGTHKRVDRLIALRRIVQEASRAAFTPASIVRRDGFQQGGLAGPILACEEADSRLHSQYAETPDCRNGKRIAFPVLHFVSQQRDCLEHIYLCSLMLRF